MSYSPTVSVVLSAYNAERYVAQSIKSILNQTFTDFEFLIGDDGSTDKTFSVIELFFNDKRVKAFKRPNQGIAKTRNELMKLSRGEFICVMDADDIATPDRIENQIDFLHENPLVVCVGGDYEIIDEKGRLIHRMKMPYENDQIQNLALQGHTPINHPCATFRRDAAMKIGGYSENMCTVGDLDFFLRLGEIGQLANYKGVVLKYRMHFQSISSVKHQQQIEDMRRACLNAWERRGIENGEFKAEFWRPTADPESQHHFMLKYGWWAFNSRQRQTALVYGWRAIKLRPFQTDGWMLLGCAIAKPMPSLEEP